MKKIIPILIINLFLFSCDKEDDTNTDNETEYKQKMRELVIGISQYSKAIRPNFYIIPQNGIELVTDN